MLKWLFIFIPITALLEFVLHAAPTLIFISAALSIVPLAATMGNATEQLAAKAGSAIGGLLNATFGNATELIIAFFALSAGKIEVVKASIVGSMIGNILLVLGMAIFLGGLKFKTQQFNKNAAGSLASLLVIVMVAFLVPGMFDIAERSSDVASEIITKSDFNMSMAVSIVLILLYVGNMIFSLGTHKDMLSSATDDHHDSEKVNVPKAVATLLGSTLVVAWLSEVLVGSLEGFSQTLGMSEFFAGLIIIPLVGNAAEHAASVFALKNKMDLSINIALGATIQIALLVAPILVIASYFMGHPMDLVIRNPLELAALVGAALITISVTKDGETNWLEGLMLLGVYLILALAFFFFPDAPHSVLPSS
jgi:Ca2+:H+ antiporter